MQLQTIDWKCPACLEDNQDTRGSFVICAHCGQTFGLIPPYRGSPDDDLLEGTETKDGDVDK